MSPTNLAHVLPCSEDSLNLLTARKGVARALPPTESLIMAGLLAGVSALGLDDPTRCRVPFSEGSWCEPLVFFQMSIEWGLP